MRRPRRLRFPVLSRLTIAWFALATTYAAAAFWAVGGDAAPGRMVLAIDGEVERLARAETDIIAMSPLDPPRVEVEAEQPPAQEIALEATYDGDVVGDDARPALDDPNETQTQFALLDPEEPPAIDAEDMFGANGETPLRVLEQPGLAALSVNDFAANDIVITIDGAPARSATAVREASVETPLRAAYDPAVIAAPDAALTRKTKFGRAPSIAADGRRAADVYARPFDVGVDAPAIAVIVGGLGLNKALTRRAIEELPPGVTLAFAPYAQDLDQWAAAARDAGHEFMLELPMEQGGGDPSTLGPAALLTARAWPENAQRLDWLLSRVQGYFGVTNYLGAKFASEPAAIGPVLARLKASGLAYVDDTGALDRFRSARSNETASVDRVLTPGGGANAIADDLEALERRARANGAALGKAYLAPDTLDALIGWTYGLADRELLLAPASHLIQLRAGRADLRVGARGL